LVNYEYFKIKPNLKIMKRNVSNFMCLMSFAIILALITPVTANAQAGKVNFSGTWTMNAGKSTLPEGAGQRMSGDITVAQEANLLTSSRTGQDGTVRVSKYTLDGKESINTMGNNESKSTAKWSADGKTLTIVTKMNFNGNDMTSTAVWSLVDAKTLSIATTRQGQNGETKANIVYDKK
jgi:Tol biopolymer transport system component